jgi:hypothetical protein
MTSYTWSASFNDDEMLVLDEALRHYKAFCKEVSAKGGDVAFLAQLETIKTIRTKLYRGMYPPEFPPPGTKLFDDDD